jgi:hypothetical protein
MGVRGKIHEQQKSLKVLSGGVLNAAAVRFEFLNTSAVQTRD